MVAQDSRPVCLIEKAVQLQQQVEIGALQIVRGHWVSPLNYPPSTTNRTTKNAKRPVFHWKTGPKLFLPHNRRTTAQPTLTAAKTFPIHFPPVGFSGGLLRHVQQLGPLSAVVADCPVVQHIDCTLPLFHGL
jgi:hypothetical protein